MIYPAKYNGINFSYDFTRESLTTDFDSQRRKLEVFGWEEDESIGCVSFTVTNVVDVNTALLTIHGFATPLVINVAATYDLGSGTYIFFFFINPGLGYTDIDVYMSFSCDSDTVYSEYLACRTAVYALENEICNIIALNNDATHGYLTASETAFGYFKYSKLDSDFFVKELTEYKYSYSRKKVLKSENQIAKRFEFFDLTMYQRNLLNWLCNCENFTIDGIAYQLISDFTEVNKQKGSEICDMTADFVETNQSFFSAGSTTPPTNIFVTNFFN